jgi:hypothetical protein
MAAPAPERQLIRNCVFGYACDQQWEGLRPTRDPRVRHCETCDSSVVQCVTDQELLAALRRKQCVAIPAEPERPERGKWLIGDLSGPPYV